MDSLEQIKQIQSDLHYCFDSDQGKRVIEHLETMSNYGLANYSGDVNTHFMDVGRIQVVTHIKSMLKLNAEQVMNLDTLQKG